MDMIERIARAVASLHHRWEGLSEDGRETYRADAIEMLQVMREPSGELLESIERCSRVADWQDMIDAALAPPPQI